MRMPYRRPGTCYDVRGPISSQLNGFMLLTKDVEIFKHFRRELDAHVNVKYRTARLHRPIIWQVVHRGYEFAAGLSNVSCCIASG